MFKRSPNPTFTFEAWIPSAGEEDDLPLKLQGKRLTRDALVAFEDRYREVKVDDVLAEHIVGWEMDVEFSEAELRTFLQDYPMAASPILKAYVSSQIEAKRKN